MGEKMSAESSGGVSDVCVCVVVVCFNRCE